MAPATAAVPSCCVRPNLDAPANPTPRLLHPTSLPDSYIHTQHAHIQTGLYTHGQAHRWLLPASSSSCCWSWPTSFLNGSYFAGCLQGISRKQACSSLAAASHPPVRSLLACLVGGLVRPSFRRLPACLPATGCRGGKEPAERAASLMGSSTGTGSRRHPAAAANISFCPVDSTDDDVAIVEGRWDGLVRCCCCWVDGWIECIWVGRWGTG